MLCRDCDIEESNTLSGGLDGIKYGVERKYWI